MDIYEENFQYWMDSHNHSKGYSLPSFDCQAELLNADLWKEFHRLGTEMIITKQGRCMFPMLFVKLQGLEEGVNYAVSVEMRAISDERWSRSKGHWTMVPRASQSPTMMIPNQDTSSVDHPLSPAPSSLWSRPFKFSNIKLTNSKHINRNVVLLRSMHKYVPVLKVIRLGAKPAERCFLFPETEFVAVTAYQNQEVARLKIDHNPYARGFREGERRCKRLKKNQNNEKSFQKSADICTISSSSSSSSESTSSSPPLDITLCDSPKENRETPSQYVCETADYWYTMMAEWSKNMICRNYVNSYLINPIYPESPYAYPYVPQICALPDWHIPEARTSTQNQERPKGSSFTIRALLQN